MPMDEILPNLYLGDIFAARKPTPDITHILSIVSPTSAGLLTSTTTHPSLFIHLDDTPESDILSLLPSCIEFIEKGRMEGGVLVHCMQGMSRSAGVVVGYLIYKNKMTVMDALELVQHRRPRARPNKGFVSQLGEWEVACRLGEFEERERQGRKASVVTLDVGQGQGLGIGGGGQGPRPVERKKSVIALAMGDEEEGGGGGGEIPVEDTVERKIENYI